MTEFKIRMFAVKKTVNTYKDEYGKSEITIRRWIAEGKLIAQKDPGGRNWHILGEKIPYEESSVIFMKSTII